MASLEVTSKLEIIKASDPFRMDSRFPGAARVYAEAFYGDERYLWLARRTIEQRRLQYETRRTDTNLIATVGGVVVGMGSLRLKLSPYTNYARIDNLAVAEAYQGKGIGSSLLSELEFRAQQAGAVGINLLPTSNAIDFYKHRHYGFLLEDDPYMVKQLDTPPLHTDPVQTLLDL